MISEIPRENWKMFLDDLSKRRFDWETKVEIFKEDIGLQVLDAGLPLNGITYEQDGSNNIIEIFIGTDDHHQTHNIINPLRILYIGEGEKPNGVLKFDEANGTKTIVHIIKPMPLTFDYAKNYESKTA